MEMQQLRYVIAVAMTANFSRAAEQCHVSQPSLSQQIQKLENELGERLFDRTKRNVKLTPAGELFLPRARRILDEVSAAQREATEATGLLRGVLTIGALPTIAPYLLPAVLAKFSTQFAGIEMIVQEDTTAQLVKSALAGEMDLMLASHPILEDRLEVRELFTEKLWLALPPKHLLTHRQTITPADLGAERFILMKDGHCLGDQVLRFCERRNWRPQISFRSAQLETIQALVRAGMGISLIPAMAVRTSQAPTYRPLSDPQPDRKIVAVWPKQRPLSRAATEFLKMFTEHWVPPKIGNCRSK